MNSLGDPLRNIVEGFFFALGFWPAYVGLDWLASHFPAWRKRKARKAAQVLKAMPRKKAGVQSFILTDQTIPDTVER